MSGTIGTDNGGFPVLIGNGADAAARPPALRPRPTGRKARQHSSPASRPRPGYIDSDRAAMELSCEVGEVEGIALAEGVLTEEVGGSIYFSEAGLELAADRRRSSRRRPAPVLTPDDARAGERLTDAAKRLGLTEAELTEAALGKVAMTVSDGEVFLRSRDLKRLESDQGLDKQAKARSAPSPLAPPPADSATEERTAAAARALGIGDMKPAEPEQPDGSEEPASGITRVKGSRDRTRIGRPRRWSAR